MQSLPGSTSSTGKWNKSITILLYYSSSNEGSGIVFKVAHMVWRQNIPSFSINHVASDKISKILSQVSYQCNDVTTKLYIGFVEVTQQTFPVVVVIWISMAVLPVKTINPKTNYSYVKTNQKS